MEWVVILTWAVIIGGLVQVVRHAEQQERESRSGPSVDK